METTVKISAQGQISIPVKIRQLLGFKPEDRLVIQADPATGAITLTRQKTIEEQLAEFQANLSPETKKRIKKYAGKTASEIRAIWDNSPEGQKYYREKYFNAD